MIDNETLVSLLQEEPGNTEMMYQLYENNLPLIRKIVLPYAEYEPMEDLLQQSFFGLVEAVERYDFEKGYKFMTYATTWIKQSVFRYIEEAGRSIRLPVHFHQHIREYKKYSAEYYQVHGTAPTTKESAVALGVSETIIDSIKIHIQSVKSLDEVIETDTDTVTLAELVASPEDLEADSIDRIYSEYEKEAVWDICERYTPGQSSDILKARFKENKSYRQIADEIGVSLERVRQMEHKALQKLRIGKAKRELQEKLFIEDSRTYNSGLENYIRHGFTSSVERRAINRQQIIERLKDRYRDSIPYIDKVI